MPARMDLQLELILALAGTIGAYRTAGRSAYLAARVNVDCDTAVRTLEITRG